MGHSFIDWHTLMLTFWICYFRCPLNHGITSIMSVSAMKLIVLMFMLFKKIMDAETIFHIGKRIWEMNQLCSRISRLLFGLLKIEI